VEIGEPFSGALWAIAILGRWKELESGFMGRAQALRDYSARRPAARNLSSWAGFDV
jgi:hypothetical protein